MKAAELRGTSACLWCDVPTDDMTDDPPDSTVTHEQNTCDVRMTRYTHKPTVTRCKNYMKCCTTTKMDWKQLAQ